MNVHTDTDSVLKRYETAQKIIQGGGTERLVRNDTVAPIWIDDERFFYRRGVANGHEYVLVQAESGTTEAAFDHEALAKALGKACSKPVQANELPLANIKISLSPTRVFFSAFDRNWSFDQESGDCVEEPRVVGPDRGLDSEVEAELYMMPEAEYEKANLLSPCGKMEVFVRDFNLYIRDVASQEERALTSDGTSDHGYAGCVMGSDLWVQARWSPDSKKLFTLRLDVRNVSELPIYDYVPRNGSLAPKSFVAKAACTSDEYVPRYELLIVDVSTGEVAPVDYPPLDQFVVSDYNYGLFTIGLAWWSADGRNAFFVDVVRNGKYARFLKADAKSGEVTALFEETAETCVHLRHGHSGFPLVRPLAQTDELIWYSERTGYGQLYLYEMSTGTLKRPITKGDWLVRKILHCDIEARVLIVQTSGRNADANPYYQDICRVAIDSGEVTPLVEGDLEYTVHEPLDFTPSILSNSGEHGRNISGVSPGGDFIVYTQSRVDSMPRSCLMDSSGRHIAVLEEAETVWLPEGWVWPEPVQLKAADGETDICGVIFRPPGFSPDKKYPVIESCWSAPFENGMPLGSFINGPLLGLSYTFASALAALGFIVVMINGRGGLLRGKAFSDVDYGDQCFANNTADRIAGIQQLAVRYPYMDIDRVGITAPEHVSLAAASAILHSDFYKVAVQHGYIDHRVGIAQLSETYYGADAPEVTDDKRVPEYHVDKFNGKILLSTGAKGLLTGTMRLADAFERHHKDFDLILLPNMMHEMIGYTIRREWDYFVRHLGNEEPPKEFPLITSLEITLKGAEV